MKHFSFEIEPFGRAFIENREKSMEERVGAAMKEAANYLPIDFPANCMLPTVGSAPVNGAFRYRYGEGIGFDGERFDRLLEEYPEHTKELTAIRDELYPLCFGVRSHRMKDEADLRLKQAMACWGGDWGGHANPDYDRYLHMGTNGIRAYIAECRKKNPGRDGFYDGCRDAMDALDIVGGRIRELAEAHAAADTEGQTEWQRIADTFARIPMEPAYDMYSACMMFWMLFTLDGVDSPGRFDQFMIDYYRTSTEKENRTMIRRILEAIHNVRGWNLCLSGSDENGKDETNELSYLVLELVTQMGYQTPNLTVRVHRGTPDALWRASVECIATGIGLPALYNDEVVCPALEAIGITPEDSHDYCMNGCNQIDIMGKSHMGLEDGEVNLAKVLELTLHNGCDTVSGNPEPIGGRIGDPRDCETFEEFLALFFRQSEFVTDAAVRMSNTAQEVFAKFNPNPLRSCLIQGCLEKGRDYKWGGPLYGHGQILAEGIADTADALYAIKTLVFEQKKYTMDEMITALNDNFEGHEELWRDCKNAPKFGNDIPEADTLCARIVDHLFTYLKTKTTFRGGVFTGGCSPYTRAAANGRATGALPNGRRRGDAAFADSIAAVPGCDRKGPTAALRSMMCYNQTEACSGFVTQMKFDKKLFSREHGIEAFIRLAKTYFAGGGQQLAVNVLDRETLLAAQKNPDQYPNLIVRVGGYSDYFCHLSRDLQQNVIDRSEFAIG